MFAFDLIIACAIGDSKLVWFVRARVFLLLSAAGGGPAGKERNGKSLGRVGCHRFCGFECVYVVGFAVDAPIFQSIYCVCLYSQSIGWSGNCLRLLGVVALFLRRRAPVRVGMKLQGLQAAKHRFFNARSNESIGSCSFVRSAFAPGGYRYICTCRRPRSRLY